MANTKVAILISTMDRPDFLIRTLNYYAKMRSPHPIHLGDSSNPENVRIIKTFMERLKDKLEIHYHWFPAGFDNLRHILPQVKEKYCLSMGDDDYEIPSSMTKCAEFLENNPGYASASGYGVTFRLTNSGPYGKIKRLADYPMRSIEAETASQRLMDFMKKYYTVTFAVNRTEYLMKGIPTGQIPLISTWNELAGICYCAVSGKSKLLDCLGFVRQIHDRQYYANTMVEWLTDKDFYNSYVAFRERLAKKISEIDNIPPNNAQQIVMDSFWEYLQIYMASEQKDQNGRNGLSKNMPLAKLLRFNTGRVFPILKTIYHHHYPDKKQIHYDVLDTHSSYYKDFKLVWDSFSGKDNL